jgi:CubicO group peptidase (beta-lactamase class C family)
MTQIDATPQLQGFDDFINTTIREWQLPGLAIAIVKDGTVIFSQGFGKRNVEQGLDVTPNTLFPIASCTKAFTATALGLLVDEGKLNGMSLCETTCRPSNCTIPLPANA